MGVSVHISDEWLHIWMITDQMTSYLHLDPEDIWLIDDMTLHKHR